MVVLDTEPTALDNRALTLYFTKDPSVGDLPIVVFHGPSTTTNSTLNTSRIQAHIFSIAGYQSFPRLTISPTSSLYSAVHCLPDEDQGDEICRGLAISLLKYFNEIPPLVKECIQSTITKDQSDNTLFDATHAARLACQMQRVENSTQIIAHLITALSSKSISWTDIDLVLPSDALTTADLHRSSDVARTTSPDADNKSLDYGRFTELVELFGSLSFIPTSRIRRAPSRPTGGKRSLHLSEEQVDALRLDLQEVLETEKSYVSKIDELANLVAPQWMETAYEASSQNSEAIAQLFPSCLGQIVEANTKFLNKLEELVQNGESTENGYDTTGTLSFARLLLEAMPEFRQPYIDYIKASNAFFNILNNFSKDAASAEAQKLQQIGEQKLRSWLIEPVQRLPRYVLFVENIVKKLPINHLAVSKLLKAKDLIGEILDAQEADVDHNSRILKRLCSRVSNWPAELNPGRLITAADVSELKPPYAYNPRVGDEPQGLILLFPDHVLVLGKTSGNTLSARGLMAEIDRPSIGSMSATQQPTLSFAHMFNLSQTQFTEANNGHSICLSSVVQATLSDDSKISSDARISASVQVYTLLGAYEGKAAKWSEEVARARIEWRFSEEMREKNNWALRMINPDKQNLGIFSAITVDLPSTYEHSGIKLHGQLQVIVDDLANPVQEDNLNKNEVATRITLTGHSNYRLEFWRLGQSISVDNIHEEDFMNTFRRRLNHIQRLLYQPTTDLTAHMHIATNQKIVETIRPDLPVQIDTRSIRFRPISPVKVLSNFLGGIREQAASSKLPKFEQSESKQSLYSLKDIKPGLGLGFATTFEPARSQPIPKLASNVVDEAFVQLEKTLNTYIVALHSRCGNVVGKVIRNRTQADDLMVNELYNILLEDPSQYQAAAEVSVDVLFAAFENFLNHAWRHKMGRLLPEALLAKLEHMFHTQSSAQLGKSFTSLLQEMTPQNQRAFSALIRLVFDLLEASGNDGDRGAITAAFAEAIFSNNDNQKYISLLDRMIDNIDVLFDDVAVPEDRQTPQYNSVGRRTKATTPGSISSATSSFKKRFGFGKTSRETDSESRVGQIIRNLSKKAAGEVKSQPSSLSKSFLTRSKSIDDENRRPFLSRPGSSSAREALDSSSLKSGFSPAAVSDVISPLADIASYQAPVTKKKRRSSLSDITALRNGANPDFSALMKPRLLETTKELPISSPSTQMTPQTPVPVKLPSIVKTPLSLVGKTSKIPSPAPAQKLTVLLSHKKENVPPVSTPDQTLSRPRTVPASPSLGIPRRKDLDSSQIPLLKPGASSPVYIGAKRSVLSPPISAGPRRKISGSPQRVTSNGMHRISATSPQRRTSATQKLRMQSPQKLRERLEKEKVAIDQAASSLHSGLGQIHEDLVVAGQTSGGLQSRVEAFESKFNKALGDLTKQNAAIQKDVESSLIVSEKKAKSLDDVYREANAENELMYEKFNGELMKVLDAVKSGTGLQETRNKLREAQDEASRLRKENQRLKRENLGLKSQLR